MIEVLMKPDDIRNTILKAIFSDSDLKENLVLKGGTALKLHNITDRSSQDLDFSIEESIRYDKDVEGKKLQGLISDAFKQMLDLNSLKNLKKENETCLRFGEDIRFLLR